MAIHRAIGAPPARRGFGIVFLTFVVFGGWARPASIDGAVVAAGSIVVESDRKSVQHLEGGIVQSLMVRGDAHVEQGQVLLRPRSNQDRAREEMARSAAYSAIAEEARLLAEADGADTITFPSELTQKASDPLRSVPWATDEAAVRGTPPSRERSRFRSLKKRSDRRSARSRERCAQQGCTRAVRQHGAVNIPSSSRSPTRDRSVRADCDSGASPNPTLEGRIGSYDADIARFGRIIDEARLQINQVGQKVLEEATGKLADTRAQLADGAREAAHGRRRSRSDGRSRISLRTYRQSESPHGSARVIKPGDVLMEIVPDNDVLVVAAKISSLDVNHVQIGMPTEVRLPSFKARSTPIAIGEVLSVAADALRDEATHQPYYEVKVSVQVTKFPDKIREKLKPGMMADVLIATGERTVLAYLMQPMTDAIRRGMRED